MESLERNLEKKHAELAAYEAASRAEIKNQSGREIYELKGRMNSSDAKWTA
ncbi:hypothetical protein Hdeb2414_s0032g00712071 [Helianthus debilis subsp. tardiflorus]